MVKGIMTMFIYALLGELPLFNLNTSVSFKGFFDENALL